MPGHTYKTFPDRMATSVSKLANLEQIGCGGFGQVFKATHVDWGVVAYKKLPQQFIKENKAVKQMAKEVDILQGLRHKNIISISGVIFEEGNYGILLEYMKYGGLDSFLSDFTVPQPYKVRLAFDVALGMNYLHTLDKPIIHGDLKIQNVLVGDGYLAKISDFGLSSWKDMSKTSSHRHSGFKGTVTHVPPERWLDVNLSRNQTEDVYAFGILLWEIFTEQTPFSSAPAGMIGAVVQSGQRPDVSHLPGDLPPVIRNLIDSSWHQDQTKRMPFKEIKDVLEQYTAEEAKKITASMADLQRQESSTSFETSLEYDGSSLAPSAVSGSFVQTRISVETNHDLPIARNQTDNSEMTDSRNIVLDLRQEDVKVDETNVAVAASSLCAQSSGNVGEDISHVGIGKSAFEGGEVGSAGGGGGHGPRVAAGEGGIDPRVAARVGVNAPRVATGEAGIDPRVAARVGGNALRVAVGEGGHNPRVVEGGIGPRVVEGGIGPSVAAAETSLCAGGVVSHLSSDLRRELNIRPMQESNGRSVEAGSILSQPSNCVELRSTRPDDFLASETLAKNVTQPKTIDDADCRVMNTAAAAGVAAAAGGGERLGDERDAEMPFSLRADPPSHRVGDVNLRSVPASLGSSHSMSDALASSQSMPQTMELVSDRRLSHSQSVPEADAILTPDTQQAAGLQQPRFYSEENERASARTLRAEQGHGDSEWNIRASGSDNNLDVSHGYYPKDGGSFQRHVHPDIDQAPLPTQPQNVHVFQPTIPSAPQGLAFPILSTHSTGYMGSLSGGFSLPTPLPTLQQRDTNNARRSNDEAAAAWKSLDSELRQFQEANPKSHDNATIVVKRDKEVTIIHNACSGIQIGNNNTMTIYDGKTRRKQDSVRPPAQSSSSTFFSNGPAAAAAAASGSSTKAPVIKKITVPNKVVDTDVMLLVAEKLGKEWMPLARRLGIDDSDIDSFNADYHHLGIKEVAYQMLRDWRERRGAGAKMEVLAAALVAVKRHDIALLLADKSPASSKT